MNPNEIIDFADVVEATPSPLIWSTLRDVAELANTILVDKPHAAYDWNRIFAAFEGQNYRIGDDGGTNAVNAVRSKIRPPAEGLDVDSAGLAHALRGLAYILQTSGYAGPYASWERVRENIVGAYSMRDIQLHADVAPIGDA